MSKSITQDLLFRQSIVAYALKYSITQAAIRYKKRKSYVAYWMKKYDGTRELLQKISARPHSHPNSHTPEELKWIEDYKHRMPNSA